MRLRTGEMQRRRSLVCTLDGVAPIEDDRIEMQRASHDSPSPGW